MCAAAPAAIAVGWGCEVGGQEEPAIALDNQATKRDAAALRARLTESSPLLRFSVECDRGPGCEGVFEAEVVSPEPCELLGDDDAACEEGELGAGSAEIATVTVQSETEGTRVLPLGVSTPDGSWFATSSAPSFSAREGEEVTFLLEKRERAPEVVVELRAEWETDEDPGGAADLEAFLSSVPGLRFEETSTVYPGYRAYELWYEQPLDHDDPDESFEQRMVLHHKEAARPTVLYTTGYGLAEDYVSELSEGLGANQITTEQRFFGPSIVEDAQPEDWEHVTIEQAAADHHRIVSALREFYAGSWIGTGHSKGGMTSVYHRRFYPDDVDATVAYVAPISFAAPDPGYVPFLDQIGEEECRETLRAVQREALDRFEVLREIAEERAAEEDVAFAGISRDGFELTIAWMEWVFWQHRGLAWCGRIPDPDADDEEFYDALREFWRLGLPRAEPNPGHSTYYYQAQKELGYQGIATAHLEDLFETDPQLESQFEAALPPGVAPPEHSPESMTDVQDWVLEAGSEILFLYGEYDPWTGGAFAAGDDPEVVTVYAPEAAHNAMIRDLPPSERDRALDVVDRWTGARPDIEPERAPTGAPEPPDLHRGLPAPRPSR